MKRTSTYAENIADNPDQLVDDFLYLVKKIAYHIAARLPANIEVDDLIQVGLMGLLDAANNYSPTLGASFETYASLRIRGSIIDELRRNDWIPRSVQQKSRRLAKAIQALEGTLKRAPSDTEIARHMSLDLNTYYEMLRDSAMGRVTPIDADEIHTDDHNPQKNIESEGLKRDVAAKIEALPEREKLVMSLYYERELNLKEIGQVLNVSESRVSQIHSQAIARLRSQLQPWLGTNNTEQD